ncbi:hypothetical protein C7M84_023301 [Penaeus vannamei]|uniref:Uncharacterized protein n=1 Tax=Penaeus vannamei TaxID=6689 RepID=A0A423U467_PENVA|nr:hypothetical protein C7M84_023301 [Penaeus vannamei]
MRHGDSLSEEIYYIAFHRSLSPLLSPFPFPSPFTPAKHLHILTLPLPSLTPLTSDFLLFRSPLYFATQSPSSSIHYPFPSFYSLSIPFFSLPNPLPLFPTSTIHYPIPSFHYSLPNPLLPLFTTQSPPSTIHYPIPSSTIHYQSPPSTIPLSLLHYSLPIPPSTIPPIPSSLFTTNPLHFSLPSFTIHYPILSSSLYHTIHYPIPFFLQSQPIPFFLQSPIPFFLQSTQSPSFSNHNPIPSFLMHYPIPSFLYTPLPNPLLLLLPPSLFEPLSSPLRFLCDRSKDVMTLEEVRREGDEGGQSAARRSIYKWHHGKTGPNSWHRRRGDFHLRSRDPEITHPSSKIPIYLLPNFPIFSSMAYLPPVQPANLAPIADLRAAKFTYQFPLFSFYGLSPPCPFY